MGQWQSEMRKVMNEDVPFRVHQYHGSNRIKDPMALAEFDVVVTTYTVLGSEFGMFIPLKRDRSLDLVHCT